YFFFQAEDGIRDRNVTGVQTCALPIYPERHKKITATYYGMISMMDKYIGKILDQLDELGIADNTIVVFTTDHGYFFGQHGLQARSDERRVGKECRSGWWVCDV